MVKLWMQPIAQVVEASLEDYEIGLKACEEAAKIWMQVSSLLRIFKAKYGWTANKVYLYLIRFLLLREVIS